MKDSSTGLIETSSNLSDSTFLGFILRLGVASQFLPTSAVLTTSERSASNAMAKTQVIVTNAKSARRAREYFNC